jgi:hypothetical protein
MPQTIQLTRCLFRSFIQFRPVLILLALVAVSTLAAVSPAQQQATVASSSTDDGPQLRVSTPKSTYRQGEMIPLDLAFTAKEDKHYQINMATYDRSGRMSYESFRVEPADGTSDPLAVYFKAHVAFMMGGLTNFQFLSPKPYVVHLNLNEWVRFDKPGNYRITVESSRVGSSRVETFSRGGRNGIVSNGLDLRIVASDPAREESELKGILTDFDSSPPPKWEMRVTSTERMAATTKLRYLTSADAAREMARHLRGDENQVDWQCLFGLVGSPNREAGLQEMHRLLFDPDFPVTGMFLQAMALIPLTAENDAKSLQLAMASNMVDERSMLLQALPTKQGHALAISTDTLLSSEPPTAEGEAHQQLVATLISNFDQLSLDQKNWWLGMKWETVKSPQWLPTLQKIALEYVDYPGPSNASPGYEHLQLSGSALDRWYELDPDSARPAVIAEILRPRPRYNGITLGMLPDQVLASEEHQIADHFVATNDWVIEGRLASLLYRYADADVLNEVLPKIMQKVNGANPWPCAPENYSVAYVAKVDTERAKPLRERVSTLPCGKSPLSQFTP